MLHSNQEGSHRQPHGQTSAIVHQTLSRRGFPDAPEGRQRTRSPAKADIPRTDLGASTGSPPRPTFACLPLPPGRYRPRVLLPPSSVPEPGEVLISGEKPCSFWACERQARVSNHRPRVRPSHALIFPLAMLPHFAPQTIISNSQRISLGFCLCLSTLRARTILLLDR